MKEKSKIIASILIVAILLINSIATVVIAASNIDPTKTTGSLTIVKKARTQEDINNESEGRLLAGVRFRIYRIDDFSEETTVPTKYEDAKSNNYQNPDPENDKMWYTESEVTGTNGEVKFDDLPLGRYLVEEVEGPDYIIQKIGNFIIDIPRTEDDGYTLNYDVKVIPKNEVVYGGITLTKNGVDNEQEDGVKPLQGVTFKLQREKESGVWEDYPPEGWDLEKSYLTTDEDGKIQVTGLQTGHYRFIEDNIGDNKGYILDNKHVYDFTVSMDKENQKTKVDPESIEVLNDKPTIDKLVEKYSRDNEKNNNPTTDGSENSFDKGDTVTYKVVVDDVPKAIEDLKVFKISDTMDSNLKYEKGSISVKAYKRAEPKDGEIVLTKDEDYVLTEDNETGEIWIVEFNESGKTKLKDCYKIEIEYNAVVLAEEKQESKLGYNNNSKLTYSANVDVSVEGPENPTDTEETEDDELVYTGGFKIEKKEKEQEGKSLSGAQFKLVANEDDAKKKTNFIKDKDGNEIILTSDDDGLAEYWGLTYGTYYLVEVKAPVDENGVSYNLLREPTKIQINATSYSSASSYTIINRKGFQLPETGGIGTLIFTVGGLLLVIIGVVLYKKNNKEN